jgi:hypothetical protein
VIPVLSEVRPSFDFFDQNNKASSSAVEQNFLTASYLATSMEQLMTTFSILPESFLSLVEDDNPEFNNGVWTWENSQSQGAESFSIRLEAEETNSRVNWAMYISANTEEANYNNLKLFDGFILTDSNEGEWSIYSEDDNSNSEVAMTFDWIVESDDMASFNFTFSDAENTSFSFVKNTPDNTLNVNSGNEVVTVYWNSTTETGYYDITGGERLCWDSSGNNTPCN